MSVIHITQIQKKITDLFEADLDLSDIKSTDAERDHKILTRCLAAYAVYCTVECTTKEASQAIVDGGNDNGIDAIYYSPQNRSMVIVQAKFSKTGTGEPESAGIAKFTTGAKDLFNLNFTHFNDKVKKREAQIENALNAFETKYQLILIDTHSAKDLSEHALRHVDDLLSEMNDTGDTSSEQLVKFTRLNQAKVYDLLAISAGNLPINIEIGLSQWGAVSDPYKAVFGMVSGMEVSAWWNSYSNRLFEKNIRQVLGQTEVNEEIEKTLRDNQNLFWYFNNGITITCDSITKTAVGGGQRDIGTFKLTNIAIVNGAQTVSSIGKFAVSQTPSVALDVVRVSVRIIQLSDAPEFFGKDVTRTNNRQNRIENRDFVSQDKEQIRMKMELSIDGIEYNIMRSENYIANDKSFELSEATAALACASGKIVLTVQAKSGIGKFYENLDKGIYKELFNASVSGYYVYNSVKLVRIIEDTIKLEVQALVKKSGRIWGVLVHGNRLIEMIVISELDVNSFLNEVDFNPDSDTIAFVTKAVIVEMTNYIDIAYPDSFLATLFKNLSKCTDIVNNVRSAIKNTGR